MQLFYFRVLFDDPASAAREFDFVPGVLRVFGDQIVNLARFDLADLGIARSRSGTDIERAGGRIENMNFFYFRDSFGGGGRSLRGRGGLRRGQFRNIDLRLHLLRSFRLAWGPEQI